MIYLSGLSCRRACSHTAMHIDNGEIQLHIVGFLLHQCFKRHVLVVRGLDPCKGNARRGRKEGGETGRQTEEWKEIQESGPV